MNRNFKTKEERLPFIYKILDFYAQNNEINKNLEKEFLKDKTKHEKKLKLCPFCQYDYDHFNKTEDETEARLMDSLKQNNSLYYFLIFSSIVMMLSAGLFFLLKL